MKISKLLEYQEVDKELQRLNRDLNNSIEAKALAASKQQVSEAKESLIKLDKMAGDIMANFDKNSAMLAENLAKSKEFKKAIKEIKDTKEIDYVQKKLDELINESNYLNKEIISNKDKIQYIKNKTNEASKLGKESSEKYRDAKVVYDKLKEDMNPKAKAVLDKLSNLEKEIKDVSMIDYYKKLRDEKKLPAFVKCENAVCMGCGMNIASDLQAKLKTSDELPECPNCGRIMYCD